MQVQFVDERVKIMMLRCVEQNTKAHGAAL